MEQILSSRCLTPHSDKARRQDLGDALAVLGAQDVRLVAASACNWPDLAWLGGGNAVLGSDGLIRVALWSASSICATVMHSRRVTLLTGKGGVVEIRCLVLGTASLSTIRPLSGFLLKPVDHIDAHAVAAERLRRAQESTERRAGETRLALLQAFPVHPNGEETPPGPT